MSERKYRGLTKEGKWVYGWYVGIKTKKGIEDSIQADDGKRYMPFELVPTTVGQFTEWTREEQEEIAHRCNCYPQSAAHIKALEKALDEIRDWLDTSSLQKVLVHNCKSPEVDALIMGVASHLTRIEAALGSKKTEQTNIGNTLRDISNESKLGRAEKVSLRQIAKEYDKLEADNKWLWEVFLKMEGLSQIGSDMEGHELSYKMCEILHPELYEGAPNEQDR